MPNSPEHRQINFRVSPEEYEAIVFTARANNHSLAQFCRDAVINAVPFDQAAELMRCEAERLSNIAGQIEQAQNTETAE